MNQRIGSLADCQDDVRWLGVLLGKAVFVVLIWFIKIGVVSEVWLCRAADRAISQASSLKGHVSIIATGSDTLPKHTTVGM